MQQRKPLAERCEGRWRSILPALGFDSRMLVNKHGPCPMCEGKDRFRFDDKGGRGTWICNKCGSGDGIELVKLKLGLDFKAAASVIEPLIGSAEVEASPEDPDQEQIEKSMRLLAQRSKAVLDGDPVDCWLRSRLPGLGDVPTCLRTVESCLYKDDEGPSYHPAMIASVRDPDGHVRALHRTYLTPDGQKAAVPSPRKVLGRIPDGSAVRLTEPAHTLGIAEGIETALAATILFGIPTWAALNSGRLKVWQPPAETAEVVIFADHDINCDGQEAAFALAKRLNRTIPAQVILPDVAGTDFNDQLVAARRVA